MPLNFPSSTVVPGAAGRARRSPFIALLVLATIGAATGHVGATPTDDGADQSAPSSSTPGSETSQSSPHAPILERVIVRTARLDLARLSAAEFGDGEVPSPDNADLAP